MVAPQIAQVFAIVVSSLIPFEIINFLFYKPPFFVANNEITDFRLYSHTVDNRDEIIFRQRAEQKRVDKPLALRAAHFFVQRLVVFVVHE